MVLKVIHIGKCGGSTLTSILNKNNLENERIHMKKPEFHTNDRYVIVIRNPIARFISAFNWRYKLVVLDKTQENRFAGEKNTLVQYDSVNTLAENIGEFDVHTTYIHHIYEDIQFYLHDFLKQCKKENIVGVVTQENLYHDIQQIFNICDANTHINKNDSKNDTYISTLGYDRLKQYLHKDYACIDRLYAMGCLTQGQYDTLSK